MELVGEGLMKERVSELRFKHPMFVKQALSRFTVNSLEYNDTKLQGRFSSGARIVLL